MITKLFPYVSISLMYIFIRFRLDSYPDNPHGLSAGGTIRFVSALSVIHFMQHARDLFHEVDYPFIILHDPLDAVVNVQGSQLLMSTCSTPKADVTFVELPGGRHDLTMNRLTLVCQNFSSWIVDRLK